MAKYLDGDSALTSDITLLVYYVCGLVAPFTGLFGLVALVGAIISRGVAVKENATLVIKHCTWITRTIWVNIFLSMIVTIGVITVIAMGDTSVIENYDFDSLDAALEDPALNSFFVTLGGGILILSLVFIWYFYRMIRGVLTLLGSRPPKS